MKKMWIFLFLTVGPISLAYSDVDVNVDYNQRNFFNYVSDWSVTIGKNPDERQRIIDQRVATRAQHRRSDWERHHHDDRDHDHRS